MISPKKRSGSRAGWGSHWRSISAILHGVLPFINSLHLCRLSVYCLSASNLPFLALLRDAGGGLWKHFSLARRHAVKFFQERALEDTAGGKGFSSVLPSNSLLVPTAPEGWQCPRHPVMLTPTPEGGFPVNPARAPISVPVGIRAGRFPVSFSGLPKNSFPGSSACTSASSWWVAAFTRGSSYPASLVLS